MGWGGVGIIPTMSLAPLHDLGGVLNSCWKQMKSHIPKSLRSKSKQIAVRCCAYPQLAMEIHIC